MRRPLFYRRRRAASALRTATALLALGSILGILATFALRDPNSAPQVSGEPASSDAIDLTRSAAIDFLDTYMRADGRVERTDQGGDTVSEGQAYALLLAAGIGDQESFELSWTWTKDHLQRDDGLLAWRWADGEIVDEEPATDADLDAARALLVAADRFDEARYLDEAAVIADAILEHEIAEVGGQSVLLAGPWARERQPYVINPSYFAPRTFTLLERATGDERWAELARSSRDIVARFSERAELVPDWAVVTTSNEVYATSPPGETGGDATYGFDAQRTYVRFAEDCDAGGRRLAASSWRLVERERPGTIASTYTLEGRPLSEYETASSVVGFAGVAQGDGRDRVTDELLDRAGEVLEREPTYYGAAWFALGRMMLTTSLLGDCL